MTKMATDLSIPECFNVGSRVYCKTCSDEEIEGEVLAFDQSTRMLILKNDSSRPNLKNVQIVNLAYVSDVQVRKEYTGPISQPPSLNVQRLSDRAEEQIQQKRRLVNALRSGISMDGQRMFAAIKKTLAKDATLRNEDIIVFGKVVVTKPYRPECVSKLSPDVQDKMVDHVRKIVEKQIQDRENCIANSASGAYSNGSARGTTPPH